MKQKKYARPVLKSIRQRPFDLALVIALALMSLNSFIYSLPLSFNPYALSPDSPFAPFRSMYNWGLTVEPAMINPTPALVIRFILDAFVYGPFQLLAIYAIIRGKNWIRIPAFIYVSSMLTNMTIHFYDAYMGPYAPLNNALYIPANLIWLLIPLALAWRMRHPKPF